jgi:hypothetical protein
MAFMSQQRHGYPPIRSRRPVRWPEQPPVAFFAFLWHATGMNYETDRMPPEDEGDGLPNMHLRLRAILGSMIGSSVVWAVMISLIRVTVR